MFPVEVTYRHTETSRALTENINARVHKLEKFYDHILNCHVTVEAPPQKHQHQSQLFKVSIQLGVPGNDIIVHRDAAAHTNDEDVYTTVNKTFAALRRRLEDYVKIQRGKVKKHRQTPKPGTEPD